jgi:rsbT co-antagonist protein RsbR
MSQTSNLAQTIADKEEVVLAEWMRHLKSGLASRSGRIGDAELAQQAKTFLTLLREALVGGEDMEGRGYEAVRNFLGDLSRSRAVQGFSPTDTATFVFSLKQALFSAVEGVSEEVWKLNTLLDSLGLYTMEVFQRSREQVIIRQQQEIAELSTPVVKLWDGVLALPLIGTLDSERTQVVMENLLQGIVDHGADIAIIDITGVPTVDTLVAQHLLKTIAAARLMGADCVISGIRPQIAQTMVHLGVELDVVSKATLADAFAVALQRQGRTVVRRQAAKDPSRA